MADLTLIAWNFVQECGLMYRTAEPYVCQYAAYSRELTTASLIDTTFYLDVCHIESFIFLDTTISVVLL